MKLTAYALMALSQILFINTALAKTKFEQVKVTGSTEQLLKLSSPNSSTFTGEDFLNKNLNHLEEAYNLTPNLSTSGGSNRTRYIQIRGIGERSEYDSVPTYSVGYYYDHIDFSGVSGVLTSFDTKNLDILSGPQSYLYGDSSIGGNVLVQSSQPYEEQTKVQIATGSQEHKRIGIQYNKAINDVFSMKVGGEGHQSNGFYKNTYLNEHTSDQDEIFLNAGSNIDLNGISIRTSHIFAKSNNGYDVWNAYSNDFTTFTDKPGEDAQESFGHSIEALVTLSKKSRLNFIISTVNHDLNYTYDEDWGNNTFWNNLAGYNDDYDYNKSYKRSKKNLHVKAIYQQDFSYLTWTTGLHLYQRSEDSLIRSFKNSAERSQLNTDFTSNHVALFTGANININPSTQINTNLRFEQQSLDYSDSDSYTNDLKNDLFGFNISAIKKINSKNSLELKVSRGFKGAGFNPDLNLTLSQQEYAPESLINYEITHRANLKWADIHLTAFYMTRTNQQISASSQDDPLDPSNFTVYTDNAAKSKNYGLEAQSKFFISSNLSLQLAAGVLTAKFIDYEREGIIYDGRDLAHSPRGTYSAQISYSLNSKLNAHIYGNGKTPFYFSNSHDQKSESYFILGANIAYQASPKLSLNLWGKNLFDERYATRGFYFPNRPPDWESELYTQNGSPLEYGVTARYLF